MASPEYDAITNAARQAIEVLLRLRGKDIALIPKTGSYVIKPGGGRDYVANAPRATQVFALTRLDDDTVEAAPTDEGKARKRSYRLTGRHTAVVRPGDAWEEDGTRYEVETVDDSTGYKVAAQVTAFVKDLGHG